MANTWRSIILTARRCAEGARWIAAVALVLSCSGASACACPFCTALAPTFAQWREQSATVALVEVQSQSANNRATLLVHRATKGAERLTAGNPLTALLDVATKPGALLLVFGPA